MSDPMRPEDFGESGKLVVNRARQIASRQDSSTVTPAHLFLGVAELEDAVIEECFAHAGLVLEAIAAEVRSRLPAGDETNEPFTGPTGTALQRAADAAAATGHAIEAPHILIGVLLDTDGIAARAVAKAGVEIETMHERLWRMLAEGRWSAEAYQQRRAIQQPGTSTPSELLRSLGRDLTVAARAGELSPIIGRGKELDELSTILCGMRKHNAVLIGDAGVGKTAVVEGLAQQIVAGDVPPQLQGMTIQTVEVGSLVAGTQYRGQFEEKVKDLIDEARARSDLILFIDELHTLIGAGRAEGVTADAADYLKPALTEGTLKVVGATTTDEFRHIEQDSALMRRFQQVVVEEPSPDEALEILKGLRPRYEAFHAVTVEDGALEACIDLSVRHMHDRRLPDKALDLLDRSCTLKKLAGGTGEPAVTGDDLTAMVSGLLNIPTAKLRPEEARRLSELADALKRRVIGQDEAIDAVIDQIRGARTMENPKRPHGVFLLAGPTGVGKTRLAQELAAGLFGGADHLIRVKMSDYSPGRGRLTGAVRAKPHSVLLLDEMDRVGAETLDPFLEVFDTGTLTDPAGRKIDFRNAVIMMTSTVGARQVQAERRIGFGAGDGDEPRYDDMRRAVDRELERVFPREFLSRLDDVLVFRPLSRDSLRAITGLLLEDLIPMRLEWSDAALEHLVTESYDPAMGARPARRAIQRLVRNPLSLMLATGALDERDTVAVTLSDGALRFAKR
jgi:ATP-dependent Clp protease ATP-binding subunit ClpC